MADSRPRQPDFFILGGMKCGTTSLFNYLAQHPRILPPAAKELHYYDEHHYRGRGLDDYLGNFPVRGADTLSGEATPFYLTHPHAPAWLSRDFPAAKLIVLMRDPVARFWSQYQQMYSKGRITGSAKEVIALELEQGEQEWQKVLADPGLPVTGLKRCSLLRRGRYAEQLLRWFEHVPRDRFLLLFTEDLLADRRAVVDRTLEFLGLETAPGMDLAALHHTRKYPPVPVGLRQRLEEHYAPANRQLAELLGEEPPWD